MTMFKRWTSGKHILACLGVWLFLNIVATFLPPPNKAAASIGIIGGADGPTAIYITVKSWVKRHYTKWGFTSVFGNHPMVTCMEAKGLVCFKEGGKAKLYYPAVYREDAVTQETRNFLSKVYRGSISLMMSAMGERQEFSQEEIEVLYMILEKAEEAKKDGRMVRQGWN